MVYYIREYLDNIYSSFFRTINFKSFPDNVRRSGATLKFNPLKYVFKYRRALFKNFFFFSASFIFIGSGRVCVEFNKDGFRISVELDGMFYLRILFVDK